jgi:plasmid stabilization system protein ParE
LAKKYYVQLTASAERDLHAARDYIAQDKPSAADKWLGGMLRRISSLRRMPFRCEVIPNDIELQREFIFTVERETVIVARVFHAARILTDQHLS